MGSTNAKVWLARSQFFNKAGIAQVRASIGIGVLGFALKSKISALRKRAPSRIDMIDQ